jgi:hypothetical protein
MARELGPGVIVELRTRVGRIPDAVTAPVRSSR